MLADKLLPLLARDDVSAIALQVGRPPCALLGGEYKPLSSRIVDEQILVDVLATLSGGEHLLNLEQGASWEHAADVGVVRVRAAYDRGVLKATLQRIAQAAPKKRNSRRPASAPASAPVGDKPTSDRPARSSRPPSSPVKPKRSSRRPPRLESMSIPVGAQRTPSGPMIQSSIEPPPLEMHNAIELGDPPDDELEMVGGFEQQLVHDPPPAPRSPVPAPRSPVPAPSYARADRDDPLDDLFGRARAQRATDLHVLAERPPTLRIATQLVPQDYCFEAGYAEELILARVPPAQRAVLERDGSCDFSLLHATYGRFRANVTRQRTGIKLTARPIGDHIPTLEELGLPEAIARATHHHQGLIVITGPTGHGKTTTLAALVGIINRETAHHVITVEDPIEYIHPTAQAVVSQREVGTHTKSFQAALKGSLREDPDVIVVGELRDTETVRMALSASETGHLVISTMNTPSAAKAIERLIDLFPPGDQPQVRMTLAGGLRLIVSQRLLPDAEGTGLCAAAEVLPGNLPLWNLIRENRTYQIASLQQRGKALGIVRLDESLAELVRSGRTTLASAKEWAEQPEHFEAMVRGRPIIQRPVDAPVGPSPISRAASQAASAGARAAANMAAATPKVAAELGKQMMSRANKLLRNEPK